MRVTAGIGITAAIWLVKVSVMASSHVSSLKVSAGGHSVAEQLSGTTPSNGTEWTPSQQPAEYYRAAAARARSLEQDATTPRVKQHLRELIERYDRLAGEVEKAAEKDAAGNPPRFP